MSIIQAHINQGENKTVITIEYVKNHKEKIAKQILTALSLKKVWEIVKTPLHACKDCGCHKCGGKKDNKW